MLLFCIISFIYFSFPPRAVFLSFPYLLIYLFGFFLGINLNKLKMCRPKKHLLQKLLFIKTKIGHTHVDFINYLSIIFSYQTARRINRNVCRSITALIADDGLAHHQKRTTIIIANLCKAKNYKHLLLKNLYDLSLI